MDSITVRQFKHSKVVHHCWNARGTNYNNRKIINESIGKNLFNIQSVDVKQLSVKCFF